MHAHALAKFQAIISMYSWFINNVLAFRSVPTLFLQFSLNFHMPLNQVYVIKNEVFVVFIIRFLLLNITVKKSVTVSILSWLQTLLYLTLCVSQQHVCWKAGLCVCVCARERETEIFQETDSCRCDLGIMYQFQDAYFLKKIHNFLFPHLFKNSFDLCLFSVWVFIGLVKLCRMDTRSVPWSII